MVCFRYITVNTLHIGDNKDDDDDDIIIIIIIITVGETGNPLPWCDMF
jgi:hypothetical protein